MVGGPSEQPFDKLRNRRARRGPTPSRRRGGTPKNKKCCYLCIGMRHLKAHQATLRHGVLLWALWYGLMTLGLSMSVHWCHGEVASVRMALSQGPACSCETPKPCCKDEQIRLQLDDEHVASSGEATPVSPASFTPTMPVTIAYSPEGVAALRISVELPPPKVTLPAEQAFVFGFLC